MTAYYNEFDPQAAEWLRILILQGNIAPGFVDERSIVEVDPDELRQYTQCHFFAGIGGWSYALRLAGWSDNRPCWTGSPPCQPFSNAGKRKAQADARHLWPVFFNLVSKCKPPAIFGEQVEAAIRTGWLDDLQDDLEAEGYATGKIVLPACSVGAPHIRQRIWFVAERLADTRLQRQEERQEQTAGGKQCSEISGLAKPDQQQWDGGGNAGTAGRRESTNIGAGCGLANTTGDRCQRQGQRWQTEEGREPQPGTTGELSQGLERPSADSTTDAPDSFWSAPDWLYCRDGKWRPVPAECKFLLLADGFWYRMDDVLSELIAKAIQGVEDYAAITGTRPEEVLRNLWEANGKETIQREIARPWSVFKDEVLWTILRGKGSVGEKSEPKHTGQQKKITEADRRMLRDLQSQIESEHPSLRWKPAEQRQQEPANLVSELSQFLAQCEQAHGEYSARKNEGGFPLAGKCVGRVGLLRGYGNAIVSEVAAEVIRAYMESE